MVGEGRVQGGGGKRPLRTVSTDKTTAWRAVRRAAGLMLGRCSLIPENDPDFGRSEEEVARHWCERSGIPYLGRADIGHDVDNKVVPFGLC